MEINVLPAKAYDWKEENGIWFKGYFIYQNEIYRGLDAVRFLNEKKEKLGDLLISFTGSFAFILSMDGYYLAAVDRIRSFPLFFAKNQNKEWYISDSTEYLCSKIQLLTLDKVSMNEIRTTGLYVTQAYTLIDGISMIQAGEIIRLSDGENEAERHFYFEYSHKDYIRGPKKELKNKFDQAYTAAGKNMIQALNGRTAVIPLSGGADSRMILQELKKQEYKNIICFTYGQSEWKECKLSKAVAEYFGCKWYIVEYNHSEAAKLLSSDMLKDYLSYGGREVSLAHIQDFYALNYLTKEHLIPKDAVFIPGHSGDMIAGSHLSHEQLTADQIDYALFKKYLYHQFYRKNSVAPEIDQRIDAAFQAEDKKQTDPMFWISKLESFNIRERQAKFIVNSVRAYEFFGYEWLVPLWDNAIFEFWQHIDRNQLYERKLYFELVDQIEVPFMDNEITYARVTSKIRKIPVISTIGRKIIRCRDYYTNKLCLYNVMDYKSYLLYVLKAPARFDSNDVLLEVYLKKLKKKWK